MARAPIKTSGSSPWGPNQIVTATDMNNIGDNLDAALNGIRSMAQQISTFNGTATVQTIIPAFTLTRIGKGGVFQLQANLLASVTTSFCNFGFWLQAPSASIQYITRMGFTQSLGATMVPMIYQFQPTAGLAYNYGIWYQLNAAATVTLATTGVFTIIEL